MPLGMEVVLVPGDFVFDGDPAPPEKRHSPHPIFGPCSLWPHNRMDEDATWYGSCPRPRPHCVRQGPSCPNEGAQQPPLFGPCLLWPSSPMSASSELLFIFMAALCSRCGHYIFALWFLSSSFFRRLISAVAEWMSTILLHSEP